MRAKGSGCRDVRFACTLKWILGHVALRPRWCGVVSAYIIRMQSSLTGACLGLTRRGHCALNVGHPMGETGLGFDFLVKAVFAGSIEAGSVKM